MSLAALDNRNLRGEFFSQLSIAERGSWASRLAVMFPSDRETEDYKWLGSAGQMREWVGARHEHSVRVESYTIQNKPYENTLGISDDDRRRDKLRQIEVRIGDLARSAATHPESLLTALILANGTCYDGQAFFADAHVSGDSGSQDNNVSSDIATTTAPTAAEFATSIVQAIQTMYGFKDDAGEPVNQDMREAVIMVPTPFWGASAQAVSKELLAVGGATITNPATGLGVSLSVIVNPRLTWTTKWALFRADGALKPLIVQEEVPLRLDTKDESFENRRTLFGVYASRGVGYGLWQHAVLTTFV